LRFNILRAVEAAGSMSPSRIASDFSQDLPKLSYHVRELSGAGLLSRTRTRPVRGAIENFYELTPAGRVAIQAVDAVLELDPTRGG
jgi:DNA-binding MarR family transcriptional regulator